MFSQAVIEKLDYYVYFLQDPRTDEVFYVGKGIGNRVFNHLDCAIETDGDTEKLDIIREVIKSGRSIKHYILRHGLSCRVPDDWLLKNKRPLLHGREVLREVLATWQARAKELPC